MEKEGKENGVKFEPKEKEILSNFDDIFQYIGEFGRYQKRLYFTVILPAAICALPTLATVFILADRAHRCKIPELANDTYAIQGPWHSAFVNRSIPPPDDSEKTYSECKIYTNRSASVGANRTNDAVQSCSEWVYDDSEFKNTAASEFNLICDDVVYQSTASMVYMAGLFVGAIAFGAIGDTFGRKPSLCLSVTIMFGSNLGLVFAPNYIAFVVLRFFAGMGNVGCFGQSFIIGLELVGNTKRVFTGIVIELFWCGGELLLAGIAYFLPNWRHMQISFSVFIGLFLSFWIIIPESLRWLFATGRTEQGRKQLKHVAKVNKVKLPENLEIHITDTKGSVFKPLKDVFRSPPMIMRTGILAFCWFVVNIGYYGLTLNTGRIGGNIYINYVVSVIMELVAYFACLFLVDRIGRRAMFCASMLLGGLACLASIFTVMYASEDLSWTTIALSSIGKLGVSSAFAVIFIFTPELYPTSLRSSSLGLNNFIGKIGGVVSPYIADLGLLVDSDMKVALPLVVFGGLMIMSGLLAFTLPETLGKKLPETIEQAVLMRHQKYEQEKQEADIKWEEKYKQIENS